VKEIAVSYEFPVEAGQILLFARAVGDDNPVYQDGSIAPPTFTQSCVQYDPEWFLRPRTGQPWLGSGKEPSGLPRDEVPESSTNLLHAEQHFTYHRHVRAGDVLTTTTREGATWVKQGRRGGTLRFTESIIDYHDQHGELVVTATSVGVVTEQVVEPVGAAR
jgi:hypothetical protein